MIELNDDNIFIGQIKQLLHDFNLPCCPIKSRNKELNKHYIDDDIIHLYYYDDESKKIVDEEVAPYVYNKPYRNLTSNLKLENNLYDRETHRYLGKYLRFQKAYNDYDLMSMYNCFDQEVNEDNVTATIDSTAHEFYGLTNDTATYSIPIVGDTYTLGLQSHTTIEMCITIHNYFTTQVSDYKEILNKLASLTFKKCYIKDRILLDNLFDENKLKATAFKIEETDITYLDLLHQYSDNIRLLIKVPRNLKSSIVLLEGNFIDKPSELGEQAVFTYSYKEGEEIITKSIDNIRSSSITNYKKVIKGEDGYYYFYDSELNTYIQTDKPRAMASVNSIDFCVNPELLNYSNNKNYLLADKIIEYLTGNAIDKMSEDYDIIKVQRYLMEKGLITTERSFGTWSKEDSNAIKDYILQHKLYNKFDELGYCDKEVEKAFVLSDYSNLDS